MIRIWYRCVGGKPEIIEECESKLEASRLLADYRVAYREGDLWIGNKSDAPKEIK